MQNNKFWIGIAAGLVIVGIIILLVVLRQAHSREQIVLGHVSPLTGDAAIWGMWERDGIDLAIDEINASGGVGGRQLVVIHEDDQGTPSTAVSAIQNLISARGVRIVIGGSLSGTTLAMAPIAERNKVILLSPSAQSPRISQAGDFVFRIFASSTVEGAHLADVAIRSGIRTVAILYLNNDYGVGLRTVIAERVQGRIRIVAEEAYGSDTRDFRTHIQKAVGATSPDGLFLLGYPTDMGTNLKQMAEMGLGTRGFAPNSFEGEEIIKIAGSAADGVVYVYPVIPDSRHSAQVRAAFQARYSRDMNVYNGMGYDAVKILAAALSDSNGTSGDGLKDALYRIRDFAGVTGTITFDKNGDVVDRPMEARVVRNGQFVRLRD